MIFKSNTSLAIFVLTVIAAGFFAVTQIMMSNKYKTCIAENMVNKQHENVAFEIEQACQAFSKSWNTTDKNITQCTARALAMAKPDRSVPAVNNIIRACTFYETAYEEEEKQILKCIIRRTVDHPIGRNFSYFYNVCEKEATG